jgi:hypothetical protein
MFGNKALRMKKISTILALMAVSSVAIAQPVTLPYQFQPGQPARSSEVNTNFDVLRQSINRGFGMFFTERVSAVSPENSTVASASCPADTLVMSVNCGCDGSGGRNLGVLFGCELAGNGGIVGCFNEPSTFSFTRPPPRGVVTLLCMGAFSNEGNRIPAGTLFNTAVSDSQVKNTQTKSPEALAAELAAAEQRARANEAEQLRRLGR